MASKPYKFNSVLITRLDILIQLLKYDNIGISNYRVVNIDEDGDCDCDEDEDGESESEWDMEDEALVIDIVIASQSPPVGKNTKFFAMHDDYVIKVYKSTYTEKGIELYEIGFIK